MTKTKNNFYCDYLQASHLYQKLDRIPAVNISSSSWHMIQKSQRGTWRVFLVYPKM